jgi:hypothetical protein
MQRFGARRGRTTWKATITAVLALVLASGVAQAAPSASDVDAARELMSQGREERKAGHHDKALERFRAAHKIMQVPTTALEVGQSLADLGKLVEAREMWVAATKIPVEPKEPEAFGKARKRAQELIDEITPRIPTVKFEVTEIAPGATLKVTIDDASVEPDTLVVPRRLDPGKHVAVFTDGKHISKLSFELAERDAKQLEVDLSIGDEVVTKPDTTPTPVEPPPPPPVTDTGTGSPLRSPFIYGGFGVAGAGLVVGGITGFLSLSHTSKAKENCTNNVCSAAAHDDLASARSNATISNIGFAVAGVGAVVGVVGLLLPSAPVAITPPAPSGKASATIVVGFGSVGVVGSF